MPVPPPGSPGNPSSPIPLVGTGGLFTRLGKIGGTADAINSFRATTIPSHVDSIHDQYLSSNEDVIENLYSYLLGFQNSSSSFVGNLKTLASNTVVEMANDSCLLSNSQVPTALAYLIAQMESQAETVQSCTVTASSVAASSNVGNPVVIISTKDPSGLVVEYAFNELLTGTVTQDSQQSSSVAGVEPVSVQGQASISDAFSWLFPQGSGCRATAQAASGLATSPTWVKNGSFETFTVANTPDNWHIVAGTPGATVFQSTGTYYDGAGCLRILGDGSENTSIRERFSTPGTVGDITAGTLLPTSQFAVNLFLRVSSTPAAGVLRVSLSDGALTIADAQGVDNSFDVDLTGLTTSWVDAGGVFRTPAVMPAAAYIEIKLTTPLSNGVSLYIDRVCLVPMTRLYPGGPSIAIFSGNVNMVKGDTIWLYIYNDYNGKFQQLFNKLFRMASIGLILPSSATPTIPDSLIS